MIFNSLAFLIFIALFFAGWYWAKRNTKIRLWYIFIASTIFYGWWDWRFLFLIYFTGSIDFVLSIMMGQLPQNPELKAQGMYGVKV